MTGRRGWFRIAAFSEAAPSSRRPHHRPAAPGRRDIAAFSEAAPSSRLGPDPRRAVELGIAAFSEAAPSSRPRRRVLAPPGRAASRPSRRPRLHRGQHRRTPSTPQRPRSRPSRRPRLHRGTRQAASWSQSCRQSRPSRRPRLHRGTTCDPATLTLPSGSRAFSEAAPSSRHREAGPCGSSHHPDRGLLGSRPRLHRGWRTAQRVPARCSIAAFSEAAPSSRRGQEPAHQLPDERSRLLGRPRSPQGVHVSYTKVLGESKRYAGSL